MEPPVGFEPTTIRLQGGRSTTELRWRHLSIVSKGSAFVNKTWRAFFEAEKKGFLENLMNL